MSTASAIRSIDKVDDVKLVQTEPIVHTAVDATAAGASYASELALKASNSEINYTKYDMLRRGSLGNNFCSQSAPIDHAVTRRSTSRLGGVARARAATDSHHDHQRLSADKPETLSNKLPVDGVQMAKYCVKPGRAIRTVSPGKHQLMMPRSTSAQRTRPRKITPGKLEDTRPKSFEQAFRAELDASKRRAKAGMPVVPGTGYLHPDAACASSGAARPWSWSAYGVQAKNTQVKYGMHEIAAGDSPGAALPGSTRHAKPSEVRTSADRAAQAVAVRVADELPADGTTSPLREWNQCLPLVPLIVKGQLDACSPATGCMKQGSTPRSAASGNGCGSAVPNAHQPRDRHAAPRQSTIVRDSQTEATTSSTLTPGHFVQEHACAPSAHTLGTPAVSRALMLGGNYAFGSAAAGTSSMMRAEIGRSGERSQFMRDAGIRMHESVAREHGAGAQGEHVGSMSFGCSSTDLGPGIARIVRGGRAAAPLFYGRARPLLLGSARAGASREYPIGTAADQLPRRWPPTADISSDSTIQASSAAGESGVQHSQSEHSGHLVSMLETEGDDRGLS